MAVTIDATAGGTSANSYCTQAEAETYFEERLHTEVWDAATGDDKKAALVWARKIIDDRIQWAGYIADTSQALRWPRSGVVNQDGLSVDSDEIPQFLKDAQSELAALLIASDRTMESSTKGYKELGIGRGDIKIVFDKYDRTSVLPDVVWQMVRHYGAYISSVARRLIRV